MKRPKYLKPIDGPEKELSPKASEFYNTLLRNHKDGVPAKMVGDSILKELGGLVKTKRGKVRINTEYISQFFADYVRKNIEERPYLATGIVLSVLGDIQHYRERYGDLSEKIFLGIMEGIQKPIKIGKEEVIVKIAVYENPPRMGVDTQTIVPAD